jgi:hypothetical protein
MKRSTKPQQHQISLDALRNRRDLTIRFTEHELRGLRETLVAMDLFHEVQRHFIGMIDDALLERDVWLAKELWGHDLVQRLASGGTGTSGGADAKSLKTAAPHMHRVTAPAFAAKA